MSGVKIISLGYTVPHYRYAQEEVFTSLGYPRHFFRIFRDAQIGHRHFVLPVDRIKTLSFQEQQEDYIAHATDLAKRALIESLDYRDPKELGFLSYSTCTGFPPGPTVSHYLALQLCLPPDLQINNLSSLGCEAAFPGLRNCYYYTTVSRKPSAAIACE